jgi:uncharacterized protein YfdQ (DUF2303 family)
MSETTSTPAATILASPADTLQIDGDAVEKLAKLGAKATGVDILRVEGISAVGVPYDFPIGIVHGEKPELASLKRFAEEWRTQPASRKGTAKALTLESFIDLVNRQKNRDSVVFADSNWREPSLTAVLDYHPNDGDTDEARYGHHRVHYPFPLSEEWKGWLLNDGKTMDQTDFAELIEDHIQELGSPTDAEKIWMERDFQTTVATPSKLITLSRGLQVNVAANVKDFRNLQSGEGQIVFEEQHNGADGQPIIVPGLFILKISPFFNGDPISIPVRLRYRVKSGKLFWVYQIYRPDAAINEAILNALGDVRAKTELPVYEGAPEMTANVSTGA